MNQKQKAESLYFKFHNLYIHGNSIMAKKCALILVEEIIDAILLINETYEERKYWNEVKKEIDNL